MMCVVDTVRNDEFAVAPPLLVFCLLVYVVVGRTGTLIPATYATYLHLTPTYN